MGTFTRTGTSALAHWGKFALPVFAVLFVALPNFAHAATLNLQPASATLQVGDTFTERIRVTTPSAAINAVSATLAYSPSVIQVVGISKAESILSLWVQDPHYSNLDGTLTMSGVVPNPGYTGSGGTVLLVTFKAVRAGTSQVKFSDASVLANDGNGTELLTSTSGATVIVNPGVVAPVPEPTPTPDTTPAPVAAGSGTLATRTIHSTTHPDQSKWYSALTAVLEWTPSKGISATRLSYDHSATGKPTVAYATAISSKTLTADEAIGYFHLQEQNASGWGPVSTYKLQVDATAPNAFSIHFVHGESDASPTPLITFKATDDLSGIDHYAVSVNGGAPITVQPADVLNNPYALPSQDPGPGVVTVTAYDKAGNATPETANFTVIGSPAPKLNPIKDIASGELLEVSGTANPSSLVSVSMTDANGTVTTEQISSGTDGSFKMLWKGHLGQGVYSAVAQSVDESTGTKSYKSAPQEFQVKLPAFLAWGLKAVNYSSLLLILLALLGLMLFMGWFLWHHFMGFRNRVITRSQITSRSLHAEFAELRSAIEEEVAALQQIRTERDLTLEEERFLKRFTTMLTKTERAIDRKIAGIPK